ncbi:hypothetical protein [Sorangium sp. So ce388]|uniref:hypothetical protein n=1 Tax=Sorangium sp. So ce388 TaxID=3133309 RepID=UPI003F5B198B
MSDPVDIDVCKFGRVHVLVNERDGLRLGVEREEPSDAREPRDVDDRDQAVLEGERLALTGVMMHCARALGAGDPLVRLAVLEQERAHAIAELRRVCADHGDNEWPDSMDLARIIEKHLERHLPEEAAPQATREAVLRTLRDLWQESVGLCASIGVDGSSAHRGEGMRDAVVRVARAAGIDGAELDRPARHLPEEKR